MRAQWSGDHRELVKWGTLQYLVQREKLSKIVYIIFKRPDRDDPVLKSKPDQGPIPIGKRVCRYFRRLDRIRHLGKSIGVCIDPISNEFSGSKRNEYVDDVVVRLGKASGHRAVLLDPDTGITNQDRRPEHVTQEEVGRLWNALGPSDWLLLYQHAGHVETGAVH